MNFQPNKTVGTIFIEINNLATIVELARAPMIDNRKSTWHTFQFNKHKKYTPLVSLSETKNIHKVTHGTTLQCTS